MSAGLRGEFGRIARLAAKVWGLIPTNRRWELAGAALIMMLTSIGNTAVALLLGLLIDRIQSGVAQEQTATQLYTTAAKILGTLCLIYLTRELLNVYRRYLVENSCTSINRDMQTRLVEHLLKIPLNALSKEKIGTLHGKIFRSVDGLVHFIRLMGLECVPAFLTGVIALTAAVTKQPFLGLVMIGVVPLSLLLTLRQLASQQGVRVELMRACEDIDGIVVEQFQGTEYILSLIHI